MAKNKEAVREGMKQATEERKEEGTTELKEAVHGYKADTIRKVFAANDTWNTLPLGDLAKLVVAKAKEEGFELECSDTDISLARSKARKASGIPSTRKPRESSPQTYTSNGAITLEDGFQAMGYCESVGGITKMAELIKALQPALMKFHGIERFSQILNKVAVMTNNKEATAIFEVLLKKPEPPKEETKEE